MNFPLVILSPDKEIFKGEAKKVTAYSYDGEITILARHMPFVAPLITGGITVKTDKEELSFSIGRGFVATDGKSVTLLIEDVSASDEISEEDALQAKKKAEELIAKGLVGEEKQKAIYALRKSLVDLKIARKRKKVIIT